MQEIRQFFLVALALLAVSCGNPSDQSKLLKEIHVPQFPDRVVCVPVPSDTLADWHDVINAAIEQCGADGGGHVIVKAGQYLCNGPVNLLSGVDLHLDEGAEILFGSNPKYYLPAVRSFWEGTELFNYSSLIRAEGQKNIALTGKGSLKGGASGAFALMRPQGSAQQDTLRQMGIDGVPVAQRRFDSRSILPPSMVQFIECEDVLVEGLTLNDSPYWVIHPVLCNNVTVRGVSIVSYNKNNDGCDPEYSRNVLIEDCVFSTGDDAIAIKAGRDQDGWRIGVPSSNILIRNCEFRSKCNGLCIGSEMSAGVENVYMENVHIARCYSGIYFKSNLDRGGYIRNVKVNNVVCDTVRSAFIRFETAYHGARGGYHPTSFENFSISNIRGGVSDECGIYAVGIEDKHLDGIELRNVDLEQVQVPYMIKYADNVRFKNVTVCGKTLPSAPEETEAGRLKTD